MKNIFQKVFVYRPEIISFFTGALVMVFEILGSRIVGPYIGTSLFVWTSLIAIILVALSGGYLYGGKISDKKASLEIVSQIYIGIALGFIGVFFFKDIILTFITSFITDVRVSALIVTFLLFTFPSFLFGIVSPIVTKIQMKHIATSGAIVGKFQSIGTVGSIIGTLGAGFLLIPFFGVSHLLLFLGLLAIGLSFFADFKTYIWGKIICIIIIIASFFSSLTTNLLLAEKGTYIIDTPYSHIMVQERQDSTGRTIKDLKIDNIIHAGMYLGTNELLYPYTKYYHLFDSLVPQAKNIVMFGGAAYSFPKSFLEVYKDKNLTVVEIDPGITEIAKKHFFLQNDRRLKIIHADARVFLNNSHERFDAILGDAFGSYFSVPYQLTTKEVVQKKYDMLTDNGVVILNIIGALEGEKSRFIQSEYKTYKEIFSEVFLLPVVTLTPSDVQNIMLVALKNPSNVPQKIANEEHSLFLQYKTFPSLDPETLTLTDDFAPVDYYTSKLLD